MTEKPPVKSYCGGKPNFCTPVDAVNLSQERVDETIKGEHEPYPEGDVVGPCICGSWPGGKCLKCKRIEPPKSEWVGLDEDRVAYLADKYAPPIDPAFTKDDDYWRFYQEIEAELKEKNT